MNHNRKYLNRFLAFVLAAALIVTYMPTSRIAFAEAETTPETQTEASAEEKKAEPAPAPAKEEKSEPVAEPEPTPEPEPAKEEASEPAESVDSESATDEQGNEAEVENTEEVLPEEEAKEAEEEELKYPAISETATVGNYTVHVSAPEDAFPEGTTISIKGVSSDAIEGQVQGLMGGNTAVVQAADISFIYEGEEKEPANGKKVSVTFSSSELGGLDAPSVVHVKDSGAAEHVSANISGSSASFKAGDFSIYAIVDSGEDARLEVKFVQNGGNEVTAYVKKKDIDEGKLNTIVYDPGAGNISDNQVFLGWTDDPDYTADTEALDIAGIRSAVETKVNGGVKEGQSVTYYAMVFDLYKVTYLKEQGVALGEDKIYVRADASGDARKVSYTVSRGYSSSDQVHNFEGWKATGGSSNIVGYEEGKLYQHDDKISITGSVTFSVEEAEGHWLVFDENGRGATYYPPVFVKSDEVTEDPVTEDRPMTRKGYTFDGWYDAKEGGNKFEFGDTISDYTTVYAHWIPSSTADYTVIIWKQKVSGDGYDFETSLQVTGAAVGSRPNAIVGTSGEKNARINGTNYGWTGFHYQDTDQASKTVEPDGSTVVNVHYNRDLIVITFYTQDASGGCNGCEPGDYTYKYKEIQGLYGSPIEDWPGEFVWTDEPNGRGTRLTFLDAFLPSDGSNHVVLYGGDPQDYRATVEFYKQKEDGTYELANTVAASTNSSFNITDKYTGFTAYQYSTDNGSNWNDVGTKNPTTGYYGGPISMRSGKLMIRYNRNAAPLSFLNGAYYSGAGDDMKLIGKTSGGEAADTVEGLTYGEDISSYADTKPTISEPGYVFDGWYIDDTCSEKYKFTTMPEAGATVYAKWVATQYRVFLHPNATDADFGQGQAMDFRVNYGEKIGNITGIRTGYEFAGWYFDEGLTKPFNANAFVLNDDTVTTPYTDKIDSDKDRFWITKKLDLYAKWSAKLDGAKGITIAYANAEGVKDTNLYTDGADAITATAPSKAPAGKKFDHWVLRHADGTEETLYPGNHFDVLKADAEEEIIEQDESGKIIEATYTVTLTAVYVDKEEETKTTITYDPNGGTGTAITEDVKINDKLTAKPANTFTRKGYTFKEWNTMADGSGDSFAAGANIAADLLDRKATNTSANTLYAQWDAIKYTVKYVDGVEGEVVFADQTTENLTVEDDVPPFSGSTSRTGYEFQGWDKSNTGKVDPDLADENNVITYTAIWRETTKEVSVRINGNRVEKVYNGVYQDGEPYTLTWFVDGVEAEKPAEVEFIQPQGDAAYPNGKNVQTYQASISGTIKINDTTKYKLPADGGVSTDETYNGITHLVITPAPLTVTVTGNNDTVTYNGKQHSVTGFTHEVTGLKGTDDKSIVTVNGVATASGTDVGTYPMNLTADMFSATLPSGNNNYTITVEIAENGDGWLKINPAAITINITGNKDEKTYNGEAQSAENYTAECDSSLYSEDKIVFSGTAKAEGLDVDTYEMGLTPSQFSYDDENVTATFSVTDGELKINPAPVTITTGSGSKTYDGSALTNSEASITGLASRDAVTVTATGSQTNVGSSTNTYTIDWGNTNKDNYTVNENLGTLTVTAAGGGGDNPGGGGDDPDNPGGGDGNPAVAPAAAPAPAAAAIPDAPVPQAEPATDIPDEPTPLAEGVWALANLIMAIVTALGAVVALFRKKEEEDEDNMDKEENEDDNRSKRMLAAKIAGVLAGIAGPVVFLLTEDMSLPMALTDKWTVLMVAILAVQVVAAIFNKKASELEEDEEGNAEGATN